MTVYRAQHEIQVARTLSKVFDFFSRAENLERITPPWMRFRIVTPTPIEMKVGTAISYKLRVRGIPLRWLTVIEKWDPPHEFIDVQAKGPYRLWRHTHRFLERDGGTAIVDDVEYALPFGLIGRLVNRLLVARDVRKIFEYREQCIRKMFP